MYSGELVRIVLYGLTNHDLMFKGIFPDILKASGSFQSRWISDVSNLISSCFPCVSPNVYTKAHSLLTELLGKDTFDVKEAITLCQACEAVFTRAAHLAGAGKQLAIKAVPC